MLLRQTSLLALVFALFVPAAQAARPAPGAAPEPPDVSFTKFKLGNGLTVVVHEDHDTPIVAVNIWYHVGSGNEKPGKTGFAHLFEHLMFNGSEHYNDDWFKPFERLGATSQNGTTNTDRTNYFENVPTTALDTTLWLESDRMGHLLGAIDQAKLDEQRGVVQNEKRQGENQPYGMVQLTSAGYAYPKGHPYSWTTIGSMEDLNAASVDDVKEWFKAYYGPANATLVLAGDITPERAKELSEKYFGAIPSGPPVTRPEAWVAKRSGEQRVSLQDRVPQSRIYMTWNVPQWGDPDLTLLDLASDVLASGKTSRLYERLVYRDRTATQIQSGTWAKELGSNFNIQATAQPGGDLAKVEASLREELARMLESGPTAEELSRVKIQRRAAMIRRIERVGGFGGKSDLLAWSEVTFGAPDAWKSDWRLEQAATPQQIRDACRRWLSDGTLIVEVKPFPQYSTIAQDADRSKMPEPGTPPAPGFPALHRATLANGLQLVVAEMHHSPQVSFNLLVDAGISADQEATAGLSSLTSDMLDEGTATLDALQLSDKLDRLGANLSSDANLDFTTVSLNALTEQLDPSLALFADVVLHPGFKAEDFERLKTQRLARIGREKVEPGSMAQRVLPRLLFGEGHPYSNPASGTGTEASVKLLTREDVAAFHSKWFKPNSATLVIVGDTTLAAIQPKIEAAFAAWARADVPHKNLTEVPLPEKSVIYLLDRPGAVQSIVAAAQIAPPKSSPIDLPLVTLNNLIGGAFTSRINMNLREDKHWSYGSRSSLDIARGPRVFAANAPVQTDKTAESLKEVLKEMRDVLGTKPITPDELRKAQDSQTLSLLGRWEAITSVSQAVSDINVRCGLPDDYWLTYVGKVRALAVEDLQSAARSVLQPDKLTWVVVGDRAKIESGLRAIGLPVVILDADGQPTAVGL